MSSLLKLISKKLYESGNNGGLPLRIRADEDEKEKIKQALEDAGIDPDDIEEMEDGLTVKAIDDMKDTVQEVCKKFECNCGEEEDDEDDVDEDEYTSDDDAEVKNSTIGEEDDDEENEEDDEDDVEEEEDDEENEEDDDEENEEDDEDDVEEEEDDDDDDVDEEETDPDQVSNDSGTQKAHPSEEEDDDDDDVDEEGEDDDEVDEEDDDEENEEDDDEEKDESEEADPCESDDEEEMKECIQNRVREDIRSIAKNLKINEDVLSQVETAFIASLERRARSIAKVYAKRRIARLKNEARKEIRKINNNVNKYLTYAAKEWVSENKVKIESKLKVQLAENIIKNIKKTLSENAITAPSATKTLKKFSRKITRLEKDLNEQKTKNVRLKSALDNLKSAVIIDEVGDMYGLSENQKENFTQVVNDSLDFSSMTPKEFYKHTKVMAEMYVGGKKVLKEEKLQAKSAKKVLSRKDIYMKYLGQDKFF